ncbi:Hypp801 [Branchiostoma lanceolatum]|uniref:Hypp801 protein n=1 Tax=Branchiostoma lanceolatum TaxID=7740 RepID=A0A8J9W5D5_BRALA|nr:Hypp801 [Branchiostoma lanceolatum]
MDPGHVKLIDSNMATLVRELELTANFYRVLQDKNVFTDEHVKKIKGESTTVQRKTKLIKLLKSRGPHVFHLFCDSLMETGQTMLERTLRNNADALTDGKDEAKEEHLLHARARQLDEHIENNLREENAILVQKLRDIETELRERVRSHENELFYVRRERDEAISDRNRAAQDVESLLTEREKLLEENELLRAQKDVVVTALGITEATAALEKVENTLKEKSRDAVTKKRPKMTLLKVENF